MDKTGMRGGSVVVSVIAVAALACGLLAGPASRPGEAASHFDAPSLWFDLQMDSTDVYAFTSPENPDMVTLIADYGGFQGPLYLSTGDHPLQVPLTTHEFALGARYEIHVDGTGAGKPDLTYRWTFRRAGDARRDDRLRYTLEELRPGKPARSLVPNGVVAPPDRGPGAMPDYQRYRDEAITPLPGGGKAFAGKAADPFFADLRLFSAAFFGIPGSGPFIPHFDTNRFTNVNTLALQVPKKDLALRGDPDRNPVIGVWTSAFRPSMTMETGHTPYRQVSRMGNPTVGLLMPVGHKDKFNASTPDQDHTSKAFMNAIRDPYPVGRIERALGVQAPPPPRQDLEQGLLWGIGSSTGPIKTDLNAHVLNKDIQPDSAVPCDELRLNMSTPVAAAPKRFAFLDGDMQGFPNGRRLTDDSVGIFVRAGMGEFTGTKPPKSLTDSAVAAAGKKPTSTFPYTALPYAIGR